MKKSMLALATLAILGGCVTATPYQPQANGYGYSDQALETERYRIEFTGNNETPRAVVENYLLYRAAQVTLETGHDYFIVVDHDIDKNTGYTGFTNPSFGYGYSGYGYGGWYGTGGIIDEVPYNQYTADATIIVCKGPKPSDKNAYDASDVIRTLAPTIHWPRLPT